MHLLVLVRLLGIENVSCRLLIRMARMDMDWNLILTTKTPPELLWLVPHDEIIWCLLHNSTGAFLFW